VKEKSVVKKINIAVVGLGFGHHFPQIYLDHPNVDKVVICDVDPKKVQRVTSERSEVMVYDSFEAVLADDSIDAVHILTPIPLHAEHSIAVLRSGKHCACTVPMATSIDDIRRIVDAKRESGKNYMMMETTLYTYQFFYIREMLVNGEFGKLQFLRGSHYQDMANWPGYWMGLPPMWYGTHAIGPMVALSGSRIKRVNCFGSGSMDESLHKQYGNPYPVESALFEFENGLKGEATRSLFETARPYQEGFFVYGSKASFEWGIYDHSDPYVTSAGVTEIVKMPNYHRHLPKDIQKYTVDLRKYDPKDHDHSLETVGGGEHHGSHPHLVHEFVMSIVEDRKPWIDEILGGNITAAGICAHESAMKNGEEVIVPIF